MASSFHERYDRTPPALPSDRSTGLVFAAVALGMAYFWRTNITALGAAVAMAALLAACSLVAPHLLHPLNVAWMRFAHLLSRVINPIVMLVLFGGVIVPAGLLMQRLRDPLRQHRTGTETSYWISRQAQERTSMKNQF